MIGVSALLSDFIIDITFIMYQLHPSISINMKKIKLMSLKILEVFLCYLNHWRKLNTNKRYMHYHAVQERGYSYPTPLEEAVSVASMATESSDKESQGTSFGNTTDSQYNPSDVENDSTSSSGTDDSNNNVAHNHSECDGASSREDDSHNTTSFGGDLREKSKRAIRRPSYLKDYHLYQ